MGYEEDDLKSHHLPTSTCFPSPTVSTSSDATVGPQATLGSTTMDDDEAMEPAMQHKSGRRQLEAEVVTGRMYDRCRSLGG